MTEKLTLHLAANNADALAKLYEKLTGKKLSPEALARLREAVESPREPGSTE